MPDSDELITTLNRDCHCITVDHARLERLLDEERPGGLYASMLLNQPNLFSGSPVFISGKQAGAMRRVVTAVEQVVATAGYRAAVDARSPVIARTARGSRGVFYGYDFHIGATGPQLIEINTNAGGAFLNVVLVQAQRACCENVEPLMNGPFPIDRLMDIFVAMFMEEWRLERGSARLETVAIIDDAPAAQYLYPEFVLAKQVFERAGLQVVIGDASDARFENGCLRIGEIAIDLVYNRSTDFYFDEERHAGLREAYLAGATVVTPHPRGHALYADKRNLVWLSDPDRLRAWGVDEDAIAELVAAVPQTIEVTAANRDALWKERKRYFFKPIHGFGSKAAYRGDKLTTKMWGEMQKGDYVAQRHVPPSRRTIVIDDREVPLKLDIRNYVYAGEPQLLAARLYEGQTTNFRTAGGGFAPVYTDRIYGM